MAKRMPVLTYCARSWRKTVTDRTLHPDEEQLDGRSVQLIRAAPTRPNLIIGGQSKSGTTALYSYLRQHPDVFLSDLKEPNFFMNGYGIRTEREYLSCFSDGRKAAVRGEASASYLSVAEAPARIAKAFGPDIKLIFLLRNPVDMAYSLWSHIRRTGVEDLSFVDALTAEHRRLTEPDYGRAIKGTWPMNGLYRARADYGLQIRRWQSVFPSNQLHFIAFERFSQDPAAAYCDVLDFLNIEQQPLKAAERVNPASSPRSMRLQRAVGGCWPGKSVIRRVLPRSYRGAIKSGVQSMNQKVRENPPIDRELRVKLWQKLRSSAAEADALTGLKIFETWDRENTS